MTRRDGNHVAPVPPVGIKQSYIVKFMTLELFCSV